MFLTGLLSFFQMVFIPGFIILKIFKNKIKLESSIQVTVYAFGLSLLFNYLMVYFLTTVGIYKPVVIYLIVLVEFIFLVHYFIVYKYKIDFSFKINVGDWFSGFNRFIRTRPFFHTVLFLMAIGMAAIYVYIFIASLGTIFKGWDVVYGWNRFAGDWFNNSLPARTAHYPQLLPANWSISYVMMQTSHIEVFAKSIMPLFSLFTLLLFLDLGLRKKNAVYFGGLILYGIILRYFYLPGNITSGYADIAVSFFAFLAFYTLHPYEANHLNEKNRLLSIAFASAAAVTKQAGIYILIFILCWNVWDMFKYREKSPARKPFKSILLMILMVILIFGSWYMYKEIQISQGLDHSEVKHVTHRIFKGKGYDQRLMDALGYLYNYKSGVKGKIILIVPLLILLGLFHKKSRYVTLFVVIPFTLTWGCFFSYDHRNLTLAFPFAAFSMAFGAAFALETFNLGSKKIRGLKINGWYIAVPVVLLLVVFNFTLFKESRLIDNQLQQQLVRDPALERLLVYRYEGVGLQGKIYTPYKDLHLHPLLKYYVVRQQGMLTVKKLERVLKKKKIRFLLLFTPLADEAVLKRIDQKIREGEFIHCFSHKKGWQFIQLRKN
jgi:hypothetical protein